MLQEMVHGTFADAYTSCDVVCDRASRSRDPTVHEFTDAVLAFTVAGVRRTQYVTMCYSHYSYEFSAGKKVVGSMNLIVHLIKNIDQRQAERFLWTFGIVIGKTDQRSQPEN